MKISFFAKILFHIFLLVSSLVVFSQSNVSQYTIRDTVELNKAKKSVYSNLDSTQTINLDKVYTILKSSIFLKDTVTFFNFSKKIVRNYYAQNNLNEGGILFLKESQRILGSNNCPIEEFDNALGNFYKRLNFHAEALDHYYKSVSWYEKYNPNNTTIPLGNLAEIYFQNKDFEKALKYNKLALSYSLKLEDKNDRLSNLTFDYFRIGSIYHQQGKDNEAASYFEKSLNASREYDGEGLLLLLAISKAIEFYATIENTEQCEKLIIEGDRLKNKHRNKKYSPIINYSLQKNKYYLAVDDLDKAIVPEELQSISSLEKKIFLYGINYYTQKKDIDKTIVHYNKLINLNETKVIENRKITFSNIEEKYRNKKLTEKNIALTQDVEKRKKAISIIFATLLFISSLLILQFVNNRRYKKINNLLQLKKEDLERINKDLENSNKSLANSNEELERFTFIASHDLKTPILNIVNFTNILTKELNSTSNEIVHKSLSFIKEGGLRLDNLVSDTLEYSKFSDKNFKLQKEVIDLNKLLNELETSMSAFLKERNANIVKTAYLPIIKSHYHSIFTLFQNIIENGIIYNKSESPLIKIDIKEISDFISIYIEDNGIGIEKEFREKIFVMFSKLHNHDEHIGSGLGLSICKKIVGRLDGEIFLYSEIGKGSTFEIRFPHNIVEEDFHDQNTVPLLVKN